MSDEARAELAAQIRALLTRVEEPSDDPLAQISTLIAVGPYFDALARMLVTEARERGVSWDDIGTAYGTSAQNVEQRFGSTRRWGD